jgi:hypothetical protein
MHKLCFYVAEEYLDAVKHAVFQAGGGSYEDFVHCCWQAKGEGQYQALGEQLTQQNEVKVELYCKDEVLEGVLEALVEAHPCEVPAYDVVAVKTGFAE